MAALDVDAPVTRVRAARPGRIFAFDSAHEFSLYVAFAVEGVLNLACACIGHAFGCWLLLGTFSPARPLYAWAVTVLAVEAYRERQKQLDQVARDIGQIAAFTKSPRQWDA